MLPLIFIIVCRFSIHLEIKMTDTIPSDDSSSTFICTGEREKFRQKNVSEAFEQLRGLVPGKKYLLKIFPNNKVF